jgi:Glycosyltransferase Family 4
VDLVLSTIALCNPGGTETYVLTVAEELQRLGHEVTLYAPETGAMAELGRERGLRIVSSPRDLPDMVDAIYAQESVTALPMAESYPHVPLLYGVHADEYGLSVPPQLPGFASAIVVLHERVARRARAFAHGPEIVRLRQPVDMVRFSPRGPLRDPPRRVLLLGNYLFGDRRRLLLEACAESGLECIEVGTRSGSLLARPEQVICDADIVVGKARAIVEAMACGRAAYVFDHNGGDGWVTPERYHVLEADNFGGQAEAVGVDRDRFRRDLDHYRPDMGVANRELAVVNHSAGKHAQELVALARRVQRREEAPPSVLGEMGRLVRIGWQEEARALGLAFEVHHVRAEQERLRVELERTRAELGQAGAALEHARERAEEAERLARDACEREQALVQMRRVRLGLALARPLDRLRRLRS